MIVPDRHIFRSGRSFGPLEAHPPLTIDPDAVGIASRPLQLFEAVSRKPPDVAKDDCCVQPIHGLLGLTTERLELPAPFTASEPSRPVVAVTPDYAC
jgi:hypothetical protein